MVPTSQSQRYLQNVLKMAKHIIETGHSKAQSIKNKKLINSNDLVGKFSIAEINHIQGQYQQLQNILYNQYQDLSEKGKMLIEQAKLELIYQIYRNLSCNTVPINAERTLQPSIFKKIYLYVCTVVKPILIATGSFALCQTVLRAVIGITSPISIGIGILFGLIEGLLSTEREMKDIRRDLGVSLKSAVSLTKLYREQLQVTQKVHDLLLTPHATIRFSSNEYAAYQSIVMEFDGDIEDKYKKITPQREGSLLKKWARRFICGVEACFEGYSGLILGKSTLLLLGGAALFVTPVGWCLSALIGLFSLVGFYYIRRKSTSHAIDTISGSHQSLIQEQRNYLHGNTGVERFNHQSQLILQNKQNSEHERQILNERIKSLEEAVQRIGEENCTQNNVTDSKLLPMTIRHDSKDIDTLKPLDEKVMQSTAYIHGAIALFNKASKLSREYSGTDLHNTVIQSL